MNNMNELEKEFVPYKESLELKELGFDEPCIGATFTFNNKVENGITLCGNTVYATGYKNSEGEEVKKFLEYEYYISRPTFSQAFRFFREKYNLYHSIDPLGYSMCLGKVGELGNLVSCNVPNYGTYEEAELACLRKLIELAKN